MGNASAAGLCVSCVYRSIQSRSGICEGFEEIVHVMSLQSKAKYAQHIFTEVC